MAVGIVVCVGSWACAASIAARAFVYGSSIFSDLSGLDWIGLDWIGLVVIAVWLSGCLVVYSLWLSGWWWLTDQCTSVICHSPIGICCIVARV